MTKKFKNKNIAPLIIFLSGFVGIFVSFINLFKAGIGWDTTYETSGSIYVRSVPPGSTLEEAYEYVPTILEFYGVLIQFLADKLNKIFTNSNEFLMPYSPTTHLWQGSVNIFIGGIAVAGLSYSVFKVTSSLITGAAVWGLLNTLPIWLGMSHVNFKDFPVAAGLTLISSGLILASSEKVNYKIPWPSLIFIFLGAFITIGARPGAIVLILALILGSKIIYLFMYILQKRSFLDYFFRLSIVALLTGLGVATVRFINPVAKIDILRWLSDAVGLAGSFPLNIPVRVAGKDFSSLELPWWYSPVYFLAQTPILLLIVLLVGVFLLIHLLFTNPKESEFSNLFIFTPLAIQVVILPAAIIASGAVTYNAVRHFLFVWPALIVLVIFFTKLIVNYFINDKKLSSSFFAYTLILLITVNFYASLRWIPYSYAFINPVAGYENTKRNWDLDYWGVSAREGIERLNFATGIDEIYVMPTAASSTPFGGLDVPSEEDAVAGIPHGLYVFILWKHKILPEKCDILFEIKRDRQTLGMGGVCPKGALANPS